MQLNFASALSRSESIQAAEQACADHGLAILDARFYSDLSLSLVAEGTADAWQAVSLALLRAGFVPMGTRGEAGAPNKSLPVTGTLQVTFAGGRGDLALTVPAVPG